MKLGAKLGLIGMGTLVLSGVVLSAFKPELPAKVRQLWDRYGADIIKTPTKDEE